MVLLSPLVGIAIDALHMKPRTCLAWLAGCMVCVVSAFGLLIYVPAASMPPIVPLAILGIGWAISNTTFWSLSSSMIPSRCLSFGSGLLGCSLNLGATVLPILMGGSEREDAGLGFLMLAAAAAAVVIVLLLLVHRPIV